MEDADNKMSNENSSCETNLAVKKEEEAKSQKTTCNSATTEEQARLNKEPCDSGSTCHIARPEYTSNPLCRIDKTKPGCINFEIYEEEEDETEGHRLGSGCLDYEDYKEYLKEEKRLAKERKDAEKKKKKEEMARARAEKNTKRET